MNCRFCQHDVTDTFLDLGMQPLSNAYVSLDAANGPETFHPLHVRVCTRCLLVQLPECVSPESIFRDYAYLSSMSASWLRHAEVFASEATRRFQLGPTSTVVEVASNDGYLLQYFQRLGVPVLGVEPAANVAAMARAAGVPTEGVFFGVDAARTIRRERGAADLIVANNVLAHVPALNDFVAGLAALLAPNGVVSVEFPHLARLIDGKQFDTIYHEHFSYFSLRTALDVLAAQGLRVFDVQELSTHGGSLRLVAEASAGSRAVLDSVGRVLAQEEADGGQSLSRYARFAEEVREVKRSILSFLIEAKRAGKTIAAYGAPAKGNTLLNYAGIREDFVDFAVDKSPLKQGKLLPGTRIPVFAPSRLAEAKPDYVLLLPWNLRAELKSQLAYVKEWGAQLVVLVPEVEVLG